MLRAHAHGNGAAAQELQSNNRSVGARQCVAGAWHPYSLSGPNVATACLTPLECPAARRLGHRPSAVSDGQIPAPASSPCRASRFTVSMTSVARDSVSLMVRQVTLPTVWRPRTRKA